MKKDYDWSQIYREYQEGSLTKKELAAKLGVHPTTLYKRFQTFEKSESVKNISESEVPRLIPVEIVPEQMIKDSADSHKAPISSTIQISIGRAIVSINSGCDFKLLKEVMKMVSEIC